MALYGDQLAEFNAAIGQIKPLTDRLMQQNNALGATVATLAGIAAQLQGWVDSGDIDAGHLTRLAALTGESVNAGKVSYLVEALNALGGIDPALKLVTDDNGDGTSYTEVTPTPV